MSKYPLSKAPEGMLGTLDLKNLGKNPQEVLGELSPSIECLPFYLLRNRVALYGQGPFVAVGTAIVLTGTAPFQGYFTALGAVGSFVVPLTETHRVKSISVFCTRVAADAALTLEYGVFVRRTTSVQTVGIGGVTFGPRPATDLSGLQQLALTEPLWLGPGDRLVLAPETTQTAAGSNIVLGLDLDVVPSG